MSNAERFAVQDLCVVTSDHCCLSWGKKVKNVKQNLHMSHVADAYLLFL